MAAEMFQVEPAYGTNTEDEHTTANGLREYVGMDVLSSWENAIAE